MTFSELRSTVILALIFALRMLGLFMVLPVLALYTGVIPGATPALVGMAAGVYGLSQALLQIPCGMLSDRLGRKPVIVAGLLIFIIGSLIAAYSNSIFTLIVGRAIQGIGAIGSPILALVADTTREQVRTRAMALIGVSIGFTFVLAFVLGPILDAHIGLSGIFMLTAALASVGIFLLTCLPLQSVRVSTPTSITWHEQVKRLFAHPDCWRLHVNIFILHAVLTACFLVLPHKIQTITGLAPKDAWHFYLPVLAISVICVAPFLRMADDERWQKRLMSTAMMGLGGAIMILFATFSETTFYFAATLFFLAFNFLEASLPALVSRLVPKTSKGGALGVYSFSQFLGMFAGGVLGGCILQWIGPWGIALSCLLLTLFAWLTLYSMRNVQWQEA